MKILLSLILMAAAAGPSQDATESKARAKSPELSAQTACPIAGKPIDKEHFVDYEGQRVYFCCANCPEKFKTFPDKYLFVMYQDGVAPENVQTHCPVMGEPLENRDQYVQVLNKRYYVCCEKCLKPATKSPAKLADKLEGRKPQTNCPVMGGEIDKEATAVVQGQTVYYCCPGCDEKMQKDPAKYFGKLAEQQVVTMPAAMTCPVSDNEAEATIFLTYGPRRYYFCCEKCVAKFVESPDEAVAAL